MPNFISLIFDLRSRVRLGLLATPLLVWAGCNNDAQITVYRIPAETTPQPVAITNDAEPAVHWTAPAGWAEQPATGLRKGSFLVRGGDGKQADVSVTSFPEQAGGLLANVNRWRDQLKLAPISSEEEAGTPMSVDGRDILFVDFGSDKPILPDGSKSRLLGGILPLKGETLFFKMVGPDQLVEAQREPFKQFLTSVHVASAVSLTANTGSGSTNAPTPPPIEPAQSAPLQYALPPNWQEKPLSTMRLASFDAGAPNEKPADVSVIALPGMAGGGLANVNRWRAQLKLEPIDETTLQQGAAHIRWNGHDFLVVDLAGEAPVGNPPEKRRILAAILDENKRSWFIKMIGEDEAVGAQRNAFVDFLRSLKTP